MSNHRSARLSGNSKEDLTDSFKNKSISLCNTPFMVNTTQISNKPISGKLSPLRLAVKDLFHIAGLPTSAGNPVWQSTHDIPSSTHSTVVKLLDAGAVFVGKTITDELAYSLNGQNKHYGTPSNPTNPDRLPGGSSSGSAVAVAANLADVGLGTDTGGSIRVPASYNGLFGLRPTHGRIGTDNMVALAPSFDTVGWLTRTIDEMQQIGNILFAKSTFDKRSYNQSAGVHKTKENKIKKPVRLAMCHSLNDLASHNGQILNWCESIKEQSISIQTWNGLNDVICELSNTFRILQGSEIWQQHGHWIETNTPDFAKDIQDRFDGCKTISIPEIEQAKRIQTELNQRMNHFFTHFDMLVIPTTPGISPLLNTPAPELVDYRTKLLTLTAIAGLAGLPQLHLPVFTHNNAPCGLSLIGNKGSDMQLIDFAASIWSHH